MILIDTDNNEFELDRLWLPGKIFNNQKSAAIERNEQSLSTYLIGDMENVPDWIELKSRRNFATSMDREVYLADLFTILNNISKLVYEDIEIYVNFGYYFVSPEDAIRNVNITVKLGTAISDLRFFQRGVITMGRTDIYMGQTDITLAD